MLPLLEGEIIKCLLQRRMCSHLNILPSQYSLIIYNYKKQSVKHMKKHTAQFKYVVKSVQLSVITLPL